MRAVAALLAVLVSVSAALVRAYSVEPVQQSWSGWTRTVEPNDKVSQIVTCNWDELDSTTGAYFELFVGSRGANPGVGYELDVYEVDGGLDPIASSPVRVAAQDYDWLEFPVGVASGYEFTKGKFPSDEDHAWEEREKLEELSARPWKAEEHPLAVEWLEVNEDYFDQVARAAEKPQWYCPMVPDLDRGPWVAELNRRIAAGPVADPDRTRTWDDTVMALQEVAL